jgi:hypothetical protein
MNSTEESLHRQRGLVIDAFVLADQLLDAALKHKIQSGPLDVSVAERLAIRLLVKRFGWVHGSPDCLMRGRL